jgi:hypothetical protein
MEQEYQFTIMLLKHIKNILTNKIKQPIPKSISPPEQITTNIPIISDRPPKKLIKTPAIKIPTAPPTHLNQLQIPNNSPQLTKTKLNLTHKSQHQTPHPQRITIIILKFTIHKKISI